MNPADIRILEQHRLHEAREALKDADCLQSAGRSHQGITNRLYYAMFYAGLALLQRVGKTPSKHTAVMSLVDTEFVLKGLLPRDLSKAFHHAFEVRQTSDYHIAPVVELDAIMELRRDAEAFIDAAAQLLASDPE